MVRAGTAVVQESLPAAFTGRSGSATGAHSRCAADAPDPGKRSPLRARPVEVGGGSGGGAGRDLDVLAQIVGEAFVFARQGVEEGEARAVVAVARDGGQPAQRRAQPLDGIHHALDVLEGLMHFLHVRHRSTLDTRTDSGRDGLSEHRPIPPREGPSPANQDRS